MSCYTLCQTAGYLTGEVYDDNHSVRMQLEVLDALTLAAQELT